MNEITPEGLFEAHTEAEQTELARFRALLDNGWVSNMHEARQVALHSLKRRGWPAELEFTMEQIHQVPARRFGIIPMTKRVTRRVALLGWSLGIHTAKEVYLLRDGTFKVGNSRKQYDIVELLETLAPNRHEGTAKNRDQPDSDVDSHLTRPEYELQALDSVLGATRELGLETHRNPS